MNDNQSDVILREKWCIPQWFKIIVSLLVGTGVLLGGYLYYVSHKHYPALPTTSFALSDELKAKVDALVKEDADQKALFAQLDAITVPEPGNTNESDAATYFAAIQGVSSTTLRTGVATDTADQVFKIGSTSVNEFLKLQTDQSRLGALFTHLHTRIQQLGEMYKQPVLANRITGVTAIGDIPKEYVYPSMRVADGYLLAAAAALFDPDHAVQYQESADDFARRGMLYGWYGQSDIDATKAYIDTYLATLSLREYLIHYSDTEQTN